MRSSAVPEVLFQNAGLSWLEVSRLVNFALEIATLLHGFNYTCGFQAGLNQKWTVVSVNRILKNESYTGTLIQGKRRKINYKVKKSHDVGSENWIRVEDGWAFNMRCSARKKAMYTAIERVAAPFCDKIICISDAEKRSALDRRICREDKLQVIFNGVDPHIRQARWPSGGGGRTRSHSRHPHGDGR